MRIHALKSKHRLNADTLLKSSEAYRTEIMNYVQYLEDTQDNALASLYFHMNTVWQLAEITCLLPQTISTDDGQTQHASTTVVMALVQWLNTVYPDRSLESEFRQVMSAIDVLHHASFWTLLERLLVHGLIGHALQLLEKALHGTSDSLERRWLMEARTWMQRLQEQWHNPQVSRSTLDALRMEMESKYMDMFDAGHQAAGVFGILMGDQDVITSKAQRWQEHVISGLMYYNAALPMHQWQRWLPSEQVVQEATVFEQMQWSLFHQDVYHVVSLAASVDAWFNAHLIDIVMFGQQSPVMINSSSSKTSKDDTASLHVFTIRNYGHMLAGTLNLLPLAVDVFCTLPQGSQIARAYIARVPLRNMQEWKKWISLCKRFGFDEERRLLCRRMAELKQERGQLASALRCLVMAGDEIRLQSLIEKERATLMKMDAKLWMDEFSQPETSDMLQEHPSMVFLQSLCVYRKLVVDKEWENAADVLVELLTANQTSTEYVCALLLDAVDLMQRSPPVFDREGILEVMRCLENVWEKSDMKMYAKEVQSLRRACALNLTRVE